MLQLTPPLRRILCIMLLLGLSDIAKAMPEISECTALTAILKKFVYYMTSFTVIGTTSLRLHNIWADPTDEDVKVAESNPNDSNIRTRARLVQRLDSSIDFVRGGRSSASRHSLFPPPEVLQAIGGKVENLTLLGVEGNPRNIILQFDQCFCQIQLYTHVLPLICTLDDFYSVLCKLPKEFRKYKIGIAFELGTYVIVFTSLDLLIGVHWAIRVNDLPTDHIDIYKTPEQFIACLLHWMHRRREGDSVGTGMKLRKQAVATLIRRECHVFAGVGVYTICEIFYLAGLSLLMTESELFTDESRVGRLLGAMYTWGHLAHTKHSDFVCSKVRGWKICPTFKDRLEWYRFTNVQCKARVKCSERKLRLYEEFEKGTKDNLKHSKLHDVFEPMEIITAFADMPDLLDVVFGPELASGFQRELGEASPPLTTQQQHNKELAHILKTKFIPFFRQGLGTFKAAFPDTHYSLNRDVYKTLLLPKTEMSKKWIKTRLLKIDGKFAWTILPVTICQIPEPKDDEQTTLQTSTLDRFLNPLVPRKVAPEEDSESEDDDEYASDADVSELPEKSTQKVTQSKTKGRGKTKSESKGLKSKAPMPFGKYGQGRRSVIVICDEALWRKKTHQQFKSDSLVHNTGPLDFAGTAHQIVRTGVKGANEEPIVLLLPGDYRAGQAYGDRLTRQLFQNGRKLSRSGISFKSAKDFNDKLSEAQHTPIFVKADKHLSQIMKDRDIFDKITLIQAQRSSAAAEEGGEGGPGDGGSTTNLGAYNPEEESDEEDETKDPLLLAELVDGEVSEDLRVMLESSQRNLPALAFNVDAPEDIQVEVSITPDGRQLKKLRMSSQLALMAKETTFLRHRRSPPEPTSESVLKRRRNRSADELAVAEGLRHGPSQFDEGDDEGSSTGARRSKRTKLKLAPLSEPSSDGAQAATKPSKGTSRFRAPRPVVSMSLDDNKDRFFPDEGDIEEVIGIDSSVASSPPSSHYELSDASSDAIDLLE